MKNYRILNLGAGVQSSAIFCLMAEGEIAPADYALFADTQEEPKWVYEQLEFLRNVPHGPPIVTVTAGAIGEDLIHGVNSTGQRFASIPAHTTYKERTKGGMTRRQCTREYKIEPIEKWVRRELLKLKPRQRLPKDVTITNLFGFSTDEPTRAVKMRIQYDKKGIQWLCGFPLFADELLMTRRDCERYLQTQTSMEFRSSRCVFCPLQQNSHWREIKVHDPEGFKRAAFVDEKLRALGSVVNRDMNEIMYVHRGMVPLDQANLDEGQGTLLRTTANAIKVVFCRGNQWPNYASIGTISAKSRD